MFSAYNNYLTFTRLCSQETTQHNKFKIVDYYKTYYNNNNNNNNNNNF